MNVDAGGIYWVAGFISLGLLVYLLYALFNAEDVA